jgi:hypothetical protein
MRPGFIDIVQVGWQKQADGDLSASRHTGAAIHAWRFRMLGSGKPVF